MWRIEAVEALPKQERIQCTVAQFWGASAARPLGRLSTVVEAVNYQSRGSYNSNLLVFFCLIND